MQFWRYSQRLTQDLSDLERYLYGKLEGGSAGCRLGTHLPSRQDASCFRFIRIKLACHHLNSARNKSKSTRASDSNYGGERDASAHGPFNAPRKDHHAVRLAYAEQRDRQSHPNRADEHDRFPAVTIRDPRQWKNYDYERLRIKAILGSQNMIPHRRKIQSLERLTR